MKQKIKNIFKKPTKKALGKLGLFLIFGMMILDVNFCLGADQSTTPLPWYYFSTPESGGGEIMLEAMQQGGVGETVKELALDVAAKPFKIALNGIGDILAYLIIHVAGPILDAVLNQDFVSNFLNLEAIYKGWVIVRDLLNMFFMLLLLFSAFATIFQVEKYHLRKVIIMLIVMALLVNFSFPIALFIIDFSNSAMYFLIETTFSSGPSKAVKLVDVTNFGEALKNSYNISSAMSTIIMGVILNFIVLITLLAIGLNLLIRILAFVILLIVSPAGFAFAFFPDTKNVANDWWSALFKYAFLGPVMTFFLYLAILIFDRNLPIGDNASASLSYFKFIVPIVFLWMGLIASQKFGGRGSEMAMNMAKKTGNKIKGYGQTLAWGGTKMIGRGVDMGSGYRISGGIGGLKSKWDSWGDNYKSKSERKKTKAADFLGVKGANEKLVQESRKKWKEAVGISDSEMARIDSKKGTKAEKMALALERAENKGFDKDPDKAFSQYQEGLKNLEGNKVYKDLFEKNVKKKNIDLLIRTKYEEEKTKLGRSLTSDETKNIAKTEFNKLSPLEWKDQNIERINFTNTKFGNLGVGVAAGEVIGAYDNSARNKLMAEIGGEKYAQGKTGGLWP